MYMLKTISLGELIIIILLFILLMLIDNKKYYKLLKRKQKLYTVWFFHVIFRFTPRDKKLVVFGSEAGKKMGGNPYFLYKKACELYPNYHFVWVLKNRSEVKRLNDMGIEAYYCKSKKGIVMQLRAKTVIHSHSVTDDFSRALVSGATSINTWHGVGLKKVWAANRNTFSYKAVHEKSKIKRFFNLPLAYINRTKNSYLISTSERVSSYYPETYLITKEDVLELGQARNDVFFETVSEEKELPKVFLEEKIILYMPTHRQNGKVKLDLEAILDLPAIDSLCEKMGYKFIIKLHPFNPAQEVEAYKNILDFTKTPLDAQLLLKHTDILVTDYSSCYTDFLLLNRPVIFYAYDLDDYLGNDRDMYFDFFEVTPGEICKTSSTFLEALENSLNGKDMFEAERERVLDIFYSKENQVMVCEKQVRYIFEEIIEKNR